MHPISLDDVNRIRGHLARAHAVAAGRFRDAFAASELPTNERWRNHLEIQAAALLESAEGVHLHGGRIAYQIEGTIVTPYLVRGRPLFPYFVVAHRAAAILEYWMIVSEILASPSWSVTKLIATHGEYDDALRLMQQPQIVRAIPPSFLPVAELHDDGTAFLEVTVYTRAEEERIERRTLLLDEQNEFSFHARELIAEGRGGITLR